MDAYELDLLEQEANEALYRVDPAFARELGYRPPPPPDPKLAIAFQRLMANQALQQQGSMFAQLGQQQQVPGPFERQLRGAGGLGGMLGSALGLRL